ncbi:MAG: hypothetical protein ABIJ45_04605 [Candidatus Zixiibacteriota bacterium]
MYNFSLEAVMPFTAVSGYDRLLKTLVGIIIIPLLILIGFSAIQSDFKEIRPTNSDGSGYVFSSKNLSVCTVGQDFGSSDPGDFVAGNIMGKGMMIVPFSPHDNKMNGSSDKDCTKINRAIIDTTIYISSDLVDKAPELIWMVYPELTEQVTGAVQVTLSVLVDYSGKPLEVTIVNEELMSLSTKQIVLESAETSLFKPAQKNNRSVNCWVQVPLELEV